MRLSDLSFSSPAAQANVTTLIFDVEGTLVDCVDQTLKAGARRLQTLG